MMRSLILLVFAGVALAGCRAPEPPPTVSVEVAGWAIGNDYAGNPITIGKGDLAGKPLVITYFATW